MAFFLDIYQQLEVFLTRRPPCRCRVYSRGRKVRTP